MNFIKLYVIVFIREIFLYNKNYGGFILAENSSKSWIAAVLLCFFLGNLGVHRFYVGKVGTGILWLLTFGLFGIGSVVDFIVILCGGFKDKSGAPVKD